MRDELSQRLIEISRNVFSDDLAPRTVVVVPSLSFDADELNKISGVNHYEQRMLCLLMLLRLPNTQLIYITSELIDPAIIDYYLSFLSGVPYNHARRRLKLFHCHDASSIPLTQKVLNRPRMLTSIRDAINFPHAAHMACFNASHLELELSKKLDIPLYATDPSLSRFGTKSGSREVFRKAGIELPSGTENLKTASEIAQALADLKAQTPTIKKAVVKLDEGFSGEGNAVFRYNDLTDADEIQAALNTLTFEAASETWERYEQKFLTMSGIVEAFVDGETKCSPSVQCRIDPEGRPEIVSTHDQVLGGPSGQIFLGATFPARDAYRLDLQRSGMAVAEVLADAGVIGRFAIDYVSVKEGDQWRHYAIEINLRKGGTTHPFVMLQYLTDGTYDLDTGRFLTRNGEPRCYYATDNLHEERYKGLLPRDLIDIIVEENLHFHTAKQRGVSFHLLGALSEFGKLGAVCIDDSVESAKRLFDRTVVALDRAVS